MAIPSTRQEDMDVFMGKMPAVDDDYQIAEMAFKVNVLTKTASATMLPSESGSFITNYGAGAPVTFTLPAPEDGLNYLFYAAVATHTLTVAVATSVLVTDDNVAADSVGLETGSEIIGGAIQVVSDGTKWFSFPYLEESQTTVVA